MSEKLATREMTTKRTRKFQTLTESLEELEHTNPEVRKAKENYERVKADIIERGRRRMATETPSLTRTRSVLTLDQSKGRERPRWVVL